MTATASSALVVICEPGLYMGRVTPVTTSGADNGGAGAWQSTQRASDGGGVAEDAAGPRHALAAARAAAGHLGRVQTRLVSRGQALEKFRPGTEHIPSVEQVGIGQDVRVI